LIVETLDPEALAAFLDEVEAGGFTSSDAARTSWSGPVPPSLAAFTAATSMRIVVRDGWPYVQPSVLVSGINWWHAAGGPCLWQEGDNSKRWVTLEGILRRIDEWAAKAADGFRDLDGAALDPQYHFDAEIGAVVGIDPSGLIAGLAQDGQHGFAHVEPAAGFPVVAAGKGKGREIGGRWFYRSHVLAPPATLSDFEAAMSEKQRTLYEKQLSTQGEGLFALIWPNPHGLVALVLRVDVRDGIRHATVFRPTPISEDDRLRRAGPDAPKLRGRRVVLFGVGAIGSHLGSLLARSGLGSLSVVDGDTITPVVVVRHASADVGSAKVDAFAKLAAPFSWADVTPWRTIAWTPSAIEALIEAVDLCIDTTGNSLFAELLSRVAARAAVPMMTVALFRGGRLVRVQRQAATDRAIVERHPHWRYPEIPPPDRPEDDFVGVEVGCAAPIHNAVPAAVMAAASLGARVAIDQLTGRRQERDEIIEVLDPIERPFDQRGRHQPVPPAVMLTDVARSSMLTAAQAAHPNETGGILVGVLDGRGEPCVVETVELPPNKPSAARYVVPEGATVPAVEAARTRDGRLGYIGEWHSHPSDQPASPTDVATMVSLAEAPDVADPVLIVLRPSGGGFSLDAHVVIDARLMTAELLAMGPLAESDG
jgi:molybdopterin/thiamine biosynthesis adenylyltransferase/proteasome lid subunit RPN8/RPN11